MRLGAAARRTGCRSADMWIDTHCHLDAAEFDGDRDAVAHAARTAGVSRIVIPSVGRDNFTTVRE
ncbi:TatD family hydrolase, partial [Burkholderia multivorans]|uniref:TatD family hydrolase n=1 Tax=Burkholderia multivorans TaxID=87883 RepID=UPI0035BE66BE